MKWSHMHMKIFDTYITKTHLNYTASFLCSHIDVFKSTETI
jgi:hypothetical protein